MAYILCYTDTAGGAECIAPVIKQLQKKFEMIILSRNQANMVFGKHGIEFMEISGFDDNEIQKVTGGENPSLLLTSATCIPHMDMTENYFRGWAKKNKIPSLAVLDQWQNYAMRFSDDTGNLSYLPDIIAIMDELGKQEAMNEGIPEEIIEVTGQPYLETLLSFKPNDNLRKRYGIDLDKKLVVFAAEAVRRNYGNKRGLDECSVLENILSALVKIKAKNIVVAVKFHPRNIDEDFIPAERYIENARKYFPVMFLKNENAHETIAASDIVIGITSLFLAEAMLLGKPAVSVQIGSKEKDLFIGTKLGAVPLIKTQKQLEIVLDRLLSDESYCKQYLKSQEKFSLSHKNAAQNVAILSIKMMKFS